MPCTRKIRVCRKLGLGFFAAGSKILHLMVLKNTWRFDVWLNLLRISRMGEPFLVPLRGISYRYQ